MAGLDWDDIGLLLPPIVAAVAQVVFVALTGVIAVKYRLIDLSGLSTLSKLNINIFTPALIFSRLVSRLTANNLVELWPIVVVFFVTTFVSIFVGRWSASLFGLQSPIHRRLVVGLTVFGNSNSLPVSLIISLAHRVPDLLWISKYPDDTPESAAGRGILYLLIFQQMGQLLRWSWGNVALLASPHPVQQDDDDDLSSGDDNSREEEDEQRDGEIQLSPDTRRRRIRLAVMSVGRKVGRARRSINRFIKPVVRFIKRNKIDKALNTPPMLALVFAMVIALTPLRVLTYSIYSPLSWAQPAISQAGDVSIPLTLFYIGAKLEAKRRDGAKQSSRSDDGSLRLSIADLEDGSDRRQADETSPSDGSVPALKDDKQAHSTMVLAGLIGRMALVPLIMSVLMISLSDTIRVGIFSDPVFVVVCFLLAGAPTALQLAQICEENGLYPEVVTDVMFWGYTILVWPSTIALVLAAVSTLDDVS